MLEEINNQGDIIELDEALQRLNEFPLEQRMQIIKADIERKKKEKLLKRDYAKLIEQHKQITWEEKHPRLNRLRKMFGGNTDFKI